MEPDIQAIRWIFQLKIKFTQRQVTIRHSRLIARHNSSMSPRLMLVTLQIGKKWTMLINEPWYNIYYIPILCKVIFVLKYQISTSSGEKLEGDRGRGNFGTLLFQNMCPKFVKPIQFFIILTIFEWFTCWQRRLTQFSFACFILITIRNIYESSLSQFYCPWIFSVSTYMLQNIKETASLKWNNHFEGVAVANPHYQHFVDVLFL